MSMFSVFYEFKVTKSTVRHLVEDLGICQAGWNIDNVTESLCDLVNTRPDCYAKCVVHGKPGLMLRFSKSMEAERLSHPTEGAHAFIHGSSEGYLELDEFKAYFEGSLTRHGIPFTRYD